MKANLLLTILFFASQAFGAVFTSNGTGGGSYNLATSWSLVSGTDSDFKPDGDDDVTILAGDIINLNTSPNYTRHLTVVGTLNGTSSGLLYVYGNYVVNGTESGQGTIAFMAGSGTSVSGSGTFSQNLRYTFAANSNRTILAGTTIFKLTSIAISNTTVTNNGNFTVSTVNTSTGATFINGANASLTIRVAGFMAGRSFNASANNNTVTITYPTGALPIINSAVSDFWHLNIQGVGTKTASEMVNVDGNLTIGNSAVLDLQGQDLHLMGNLTTTTSNRLTNTALNAAQTLVLNGTTAQSISYTGTLTFPNVVLDNPTGATFNTGTYSITNLLQLNNGTLNGNGRAVLTSTASTTARIAEVPSSAGMSGNFTLQRFLSGRDSGYVELSPVVSNTTIADWDAELAMYGVSGNEGNWNPGSETVYTYDETVWDYSPVTSSGFSPAATQGVFVYLFDFPANVFTAKTLTSIGTPYFGTQSMGITANNDGWNFVGNPFQSWISWDDVLAANPTLDATYQSYNDAVRDFQTFGSGTEIAPGHGFWVRTSSSTTFQVPESAKTTSTVSTFQRLASKGFSVSIGSEKNKFHQTAYINFDRNSNEFHDRNDVMFHKNIDKHANAIFTMSVDNKKLTVNSLNQSEETIIPLTVLANEAGTYFLEFKGLEFADSYSHVYLKDLTSNEITAISNGKKKNVILEKGENNGRFALIFTNSAINAPIAALSPNSFNVRTSENGFTAMFAFNTQKNIEVSVFNSLGQSVLNPTQMVVESGEFTFELPAERQTYFVKCEVDGQSFVRRVIR